MIMIVRIKTKIYKKDPRIAWSLSYESILKINYTFLQQINFY